MDVNHPRLGIEQCIGSNKFCWDFVFFWTTFGDVIILILLYIDAFYIYLLVPEIQNLADLAQFSSYCLETFRNRFLCLIYI